MPTISGGADGMTCMAVPPISNSIAYPYPESKDPLQQQQDRKEEIRKKEKEKRKNQEISETKPGLPDLPSASSG